MGAGLFLYMFLIAFNGLFLFPIDVMSYCCHLFPYFFILYRVLLPTTRGLWRNCLGMMRIHVKVLRA